MLLTRTLVAVVALPVLVLIVLAGGAVYQIAAALLLARGVWELIHLARLEGYAPSFALAAAALLVILGAVRWPDLLGPGLALVILLALALMLLRFQRGDATPLNSFSITLAAGLLLGWPGARLLLLRLLPDGQWWTLLVLFCTFVADTGAYFVGTAFGKHKMAPRISPKKSWEGYAGGVAAAAIFGLAVGALAGPSLPGLTAGHGLALGLLIALVTPLGDFGMSAFKRQAHVKDSSHLIPGHGGMLDRLDTVLVAAVLGYYYLVWFVFQTGAL